MVDKITNLHVVKPPRVADEIRQEVIELLEETLAEARAGEISEIMLIIQHPGKDWSQRSSDTMDGILKWIGRLEITKLDWIAKLKEGEID